MEAEGNWRTKELNIMKEEDCIMQSKNSERFSKIISYYEDFKRYSGAFEEGRELVTYVAPSSIHSDVTSFAYGKVKSAECADISDGSALEVSFNLKDKDIEERRFYIKIVSCLYDWKKYYNDLHIEINDKMVYCNAREFFENVNLGWPTIYIPVDAENFRIGKNIVKLHTDNTSGGGLMVEKVDLVTLPRIEKYSQMSAQMSVRAGDMYTVAYLSGGESAEIKDCKNCRVVSVTTPELFGDRLLVKLVSDNTGGAECTVRFTSGVEVEAILPEIVDASSDLCYVGTDSDDHRHDDTDETERIMDIFAMETLGSYFQLRPQYQRNFLDLSDKAIWKKRIDYLRAFNAKISLSDGGHVMDWVPDLAGEDYIGSHVHEPYLYFYTDIEDFDPAFAKAMMIDKSALLGSNSFGESKKLFTDVLKKTHKLNSSKSGLASVGSPSMLCVYEAAAGFDRVTMEPVSNVNLLLGAVRGTAPRIWGSHVPVDWYFGEPNDMVKAKKFMIAMQLLYINGADYIYTENSIFKTNAFSREDWDDAFCIKNREYLREFYDYTIRTPRVGELVVDQAVVYGNNEYFMWQYDDRMAELGENHDWDIKIWGKWEENEYQKAWRAVDAWLPRAEHQNPKEDPVNKYLFSGTPYGATDIIPYEADYNKYRSLAFLGWNTWENPLKDKLSAYVNGGGHLFISLCHFNKTDRCDMPMEYADNETVAELTGVMPMGEDFAPRGHITFNDGRVIDVTSDMRVRRCKAVSAEIVARDDNGEGVIFKTEKNGGVVYFGAFAEHFSCDWAIATAVRVLEIMGDENAQAVCDNPNIAFAMRNQADGGVVLDVMNVNSADDDDVLQKYTISVTKDGKTQSVSGSVRPAEVKRIKL